MYPTVIDFSHYQGVVNYPKLASKLPALCYVKATDGTNYVDPQFSNHVKGLLAVSIPFAPYHYFQPSLDPLKQAAWFTGHISPTDEPPLVDVEESRGIPVNYAYRLFTFLNEVERVTHQRPTLYTRASYWRSFLGAAWNWATGYRVYIAHYKDSLGPSMPLPWDPANWYAWQYGTPARGYEFGMQSKDLDMGVINPNRPTWDQASLVSLLVLEAYADLKPPDRPYPFSLADWITEIEATLKNNPRKG